jgi:hypothetical protein
MNVETNSTEMLERIKFTVFKMIVVFFMFSVPLLRNIGARRIRKHNFSGQYLEYHYTDLGKPF